MPFVSLTRLRLRSVRFLPAFVYWTFASKRQVRRAPGFLAGWVGNEGARGFWTATCWQDEAAMRAFRASGAHLVAMAMLRHWCDGAAVAHWEQEDATLPTGDDALMRMRALGRTSKVDRPAADHRAGRTTGERPPSTGQTFTPRR